MESTSANPHPALSRYTGRGYSFARQDRLIVAALSLVSVALGLAYTHYVAPGVPYDERSHYAVIKLYSRFEGMVVVRPGVPYEGYQAPLYYFIEGAMYRGLQSLGDLRAFFILRRIGLILLPIAIWLTYRIVVKVNPDDRWLAIISAAFVAINPQFVGMTASLENDSLAIVFSMWAIDLALCWIGQARLTVRRAMLLAVVVSLGALTKLTTAFLAGAMPLAMLLIYGRQSFKMIGVFVGVMAVMTWWLLIRNHHYYGDLTGARALILYYPEMTGPTIRPWRPGDLFWYVRGILTYLWMPTEYYGNYIKPGWSLRLIVIGVSGLTAVGWALWIKEHVARLIFDLPHSILTICLVACLSMYMFNVTVEWTVPGRFVLPALAIFAVMFAGGILTLATRLRLRVWMAAVVLIGALMVVNVVVLARVRHLPPDMKMIHEMK